MWCPRAAQRREARPRTTTLPLGPLQGTSCRHRGESRLTFPRKVHLCGDGGAGKTTLSSALRRSWLGSIFKANRALQPDRPNDKAARTRGVVVEYDNFEGCAFSFWDYGGQPEFHLGHHDYMRGAGGDASGAGSADGASSEAPLRGVAIFLIVVSLADEPSKRAKDVLYWRRFIRACLPADARPLVAVVGSRADGRPDAKALVKDLTKVSRFRSKQSFPARLIPLSVCTQTPSRLLSSWQVGGEEDASGLPPLAEGFAIDCRSYTACAPLRQWLVQQHRRLMQRAMKMPRACESILTQKRSWRTGEQRWLWGEARDPVLVLSWDEFCERCRKEIPGLAKADAELLRVAANFLHDSGDLVSPERGAAARCVVLHPTWLCSLVIGELIAPEWLGGRRRSLLSARDLEEQVRDDAVHAHALIQPNLT